MNVSACLVTRGDVDMRPILDSLPPEWETLVWDNEGGTCWVDGGEWDDADREVKAEVPDLAVYGRYAAIEYASHDLIYVQDDDVIVSDPQAIVDAWLAANDGGHEWPVRDLGLPYVVCNMPQEFRPHYPDSGLVGFGAAFHRDAPGRAFDRFYYKDSPEQPETREPCDPKEFQRRADNVFTVLTPRVLVDVPKADCIYASDPNRMWRLPGHTSERDRMIALARQVRDA